MGLGLVGRWWGLSGFGPRGSGSALAEGPGKAGLSQRSVRDLP